MTILDKQITNEIHIHQSLLEDPGWCGHQLMTYTYGIGEQAPKCVPIHIDSGIRIIAKLQDIRKQFLLNKPDWAILTTVQPSWTLPHTRENALPEDKRTILVSVYEHGNMRYYLVPFVRKCAEDIDWHDMREIDDPEAGDIYNSILKDIFSLDF